MPARSPAADEATCTDFYESFCRRRGRLRDPTGVVLSDLEGERGVLRIYEDIIRKNPDWGVEKVDEALVKSVYTPARLKRVQDAFSFVRDHMIQFFESQLSTVFTRAEKDRIKARLMQVQLQLPPPASNYADEPDLFTKIDVVYERMTDGTMRLRIGGAYLFAARSRYNLVFSLAHELAHAVDPCEMRAAQSAELPAYGRLTGCFVKSGVISASGLLQSACQEGDHLSEAFSDWVAVQIVSRALAQASMEYDPSQLLNAAINSVRDLCDQDEVTTRSDQSLHPDPRIRINEIFGLNPEVRGVLGCPALAPDKSFCDFEFNGT